MIQIIKRTGGTMIDSYLEEVHTGLTHRPNPTAGILVWHCVNEHRPRHLHHTPSRPPAPPALFFILLFDLALPCSK